MRESLKTILPFIIMACSLGVVYSAADPFQDKFEEAFLAVIGASRAGGDVSWLIDQLNVVLSEISSGEDPAVVLARLDAVIGAAELERAFSVEARNNLLIVTGVQIAAVGALMYATWRYFPRLFWRTWITVKGDWILENEDR